MMMSCCEEGKPESARRAAGEGEGWPLLELDVAPASPPTYSLYYTLPSSQHVAVYYQVEVSVI